METETVVSGDAAEASAPHLKSAAAEDVKRAS